MFRFVFAGLLLATSAYADPLPSWNDGASKSSIITFVEGVTEPGSADFVPVKDRIAVFDNDGTLWAEKPIYFQLIYAVDQVAKIAKDDPSILTSPALKAAAEGDMKGVLAEGKEGLIEILKASHSNMPIDAFAADVAAWLETARHPKTGKAYDEMLYQPMLELLRYLRDEGFQTYIVSGGGIDFIRVFAEEAYGIPPQQVVGSSISASYVKIGEEPTILKGEDVFFVDDKAGKPVGIMHHIGKRPIFAGGNSDGDFQMLEWVTSGDGPRMGMFVWHTDEAREFAYDREGHVGVLDRGLDEGPDRGWVIVDMKNDWSRVWK